MAQIDFRKAFRGEKTRQRIYPMTYVDIAVDPDVGLEAHAQSDLLISPEIETLPDLPLPSLASTNEPASSPLSVTPRQRPFWLRLLRSPLTAPRRFLVGGLHLKIDGIIARQESIERNTSILQNSVNSNQALIVDLRTTLAYVSDALRGQISDLNHAVTSQSDAMHAEVSTLSLAVSSTGHTVRALISDIVDSMQTDISALTQIVTSTNESMRLEFAESSTNIETGLRSLNADAETRFTATNTAIQSLRETVQAGLADSSADTENGLRTLNADAETRFTATNTAIQSLQETVQAEIADLSADTEIGLRSLNADAETRYTATNAVIQSLRETVQASAVGERLARMESLTVNRLHEIDIKIRGPHAFDDQTDAIRLNDGYVLVPKSAAKLRILLADAPADGLEPGTVKVIRKVLQIGMTAIDVGANVGALSLTCARAVGASGKVFAFEPEPALAKLLSKSFDLNGVPWVQLVQSAASRAKGTALFHVSPISGHSSLYPLPSAEQSEEIIIEVETCRLDDAIDPNQAVHLVKMDVEGAELDVLAGMTRIVKRNPELVIIAEFGSSHLVSQGIDANDWMGQFKTAGFKLFAIDEMTGNCKPALSADLVEIESVNLVMARAGSRAYRILAQ